MNVAALVKSITASSVLSPPDEGMAGDQESALSRSSIQSVARGGLTAFFVYGVGIGLTYFSQLIVARLVGIEAYGTYAYVFAWVVVGAYVATCGFDVGLLRFVPAYEATGSWRLLKGVIRYAERCAIGTGLAIAAIGAFVVSRPLETPDIRQSFLIGLAIVPALALLRVRCAVVRALGGVTAAIAPDRIVREGLLIVLIAAASASAVWPLNAALIMWFMFVSVMVSLTVASLAMRRCVPAEAKLSAAVYDSAVWKRAAVPLLVIGVAEALLNRTGVILLGLADSTKSAGIFSLVFSIALVVTLPRIAVNTLFAPAISGLHARNDTAAIQKLANKATGWTLRAGGAIALFLFVMADAGLEWFGPGYGEGATALRILLVGQAITAGAGSQLYLLTMTGHERQAALILVGCVAVNAIAGVVLIQFLGLPGAALASAATLVLWNALMAAALWRHLGLRPGLAEIVRRRGRECPV